ncbi:MAG: ABC transporter ATP-binding protein [Candidatus Roseilinea sp.]|uniref:ABC transporter ATP-binding protein n=1 Tax=Candidatus Roseilinea sp. TaxID=2838777 RepID=UPI00404AF8F8
MNPVIESVGLRKEFGAKVAVDDLTLTVRRGEVFGFLGPNGAGKTTSMKMLLGLVAPTAGAGQVLGAPLGDVKARAKMGFLPEHFRFQDWLTGREFLRFHGRLYGLAGSSLTSRIEQLLERVDLLDAADRPLRGYSKGMLQRIGLAQALLNHPDLVFLDEPTSGLDPLGRFLVRDIIIELRQQGASVFLNSHLLSEVEVTCDRVAFVKLGRVVREMALAERSGDVSVELKLGSVNPSLLADLAQFGRDVRQVNGLVRLTVPGEATLPDMARWLVAQGVPIYRLAAEHKSLEALFLEVMGEDERPG